MASSAHVAFLSTLSDVDYLLGLHTQQGGDRRGRRAPELGILSRSALVLLTAGWEAYVEMVITEAVGNLARSAPDASAIPKELKKAYLQQSGVSGKAKDQDDLRAWNLVDNGWRSEIDTYAANRVKSLNTPKSANIIGLFSEILGIEDISTAWGRRRMTAVQAAAALDRWLARRHEIAHGAQAVPSVSRAQVTQYRQFLEITVDRTDAAVGIKIQHLSGVKPW